MGDDHSDEGNVASATRKHDGGSRPRAVIFVAIVPVALFLAANAIRLLLTRPLGPFPQDRRFEVMDQSLIMLGAAIFQLYLVAFLVGIGLLVAVAIRRGRAAPTLLSVIAWLVAAIYILVAACVWVLESDPSYLPLLVLGFAIAALAWAAFIIGLIVAGRSMDALDPKGRQAPLRPGH